METPKQLLQELAEYLSLSFEIKNNATCSRRWHDRYAKIWDWQKASHEFGKTEDDACQKLRDFVQKFYVIIEK